MSENKTLNGKVVLIVGGSGGIGAATARQFSGIGAQVVITHRAGAGKASAAANLLTTFKGDGHAAFAADVSDTSTLLKLRDEITSRYGRLDVLVNSSGLHQACAAF